jgi:hypothetical protein
MEFIIIQIGARDLTIRTFNSSEQIHICLDRGFHDPSASASLSTGLRI